MRKESPENKLHKTKSIEGYMQEMSIEAEGTPEVLSALIEQAKAVQEGRDTGARIVAFILPGAMQGAFGGGQVTAIHDAGLTNGLKAVIASSTGAPAGAYLLDGHPRLGATIYAEECTKGFINPRRFPDGHFMDTLYLSQVYRGEVGNKPLHLENIKTALPDFRIAVTDYETGKGALLDGKVSTIDAIQASCSMPVLSGTPRTYINEKHYVDGYIAMPFPLQEGIDEYAPTHILVFANCPKKRVPTFSEKVFQDLLAVAFPAPLKKALLTSDKLLEKNLALLRKSGIPFLVLYPEGLGPLEQNSKKITAGTRLAEQDLKKRIEDARQKI